MTGEPFGHPVLSAWLADAATVRALGFEAELAAMLAFEGALAEAEGEVGVIPEAAARAIADGCASLTPDIDALRAGALRDGVVAPALVGLIREAVGTDHAPFVHYGATSQDLIDTTLVLRLAPLLPDYARRLEGIVAKLEALERDHGTAALMGVTRMRDALPISVADRLANWVGPLARACERAETVRRALAVVQLGGPVGTLGAGHELGERAAAVRASLARRLGLTDPGRSWHVDREPLTQMADWMASTTAALGKLGADLQLMAQDRVAAARLSGGTSSSMPHKVNPVDAELLLALARHVAVLSAGMRVAAVHECERSGTAWTLEWLTLPVLANATGAALGAADRLLAAVSELGDPAGAR